MTGKWNSRIPKNQKVFRLSRKWKLENTTDS